MVTVETSDNNPVPSRSAVESQLITFHYAVETLPEKTRRDSRLGGGSLEKRQPITSESVLVISKRRELDY